MAVYPRTRYILSPAGPGKYRIEHFVANDPNPTPASDRHTVIDATSPQAWTEVLGRAAKMSLLLQGGRPNPVPVDVEINPSRVFTVTVSPVPDTQSPTEPLHPQSAHELRQLLQLHGADKLRALIDEAERG